MLFSVCARFGPRELTRKPALGTIGSGGLSGSRCRATLSAAAPATAPAIVATALIVAPTMWGCVSSDAPPAVSRRAIPRRARGRRSAWRPGPRTPSATRASPYARCM